MRALFNKIVYRDISQLFKVRDVSVLNSLLKIINDRSGQIVDISVVINALSFGPSKV